MDFVSQGPKLCRKFKLLFAGVYLLAGMITHSALLCIVNRSSLPGQVPQLCLRKQIMSNSKRRLKSANM